MLGQNPQAAVTAAANEYMNNCAAADDACQRLAQQGIHSPISASTFAAACGDGSQPCNAQVLQTIVQAQGANAAVAGQNLQTMALYGGPLAGVALLGPEALTAAGLAGAFDYEGDAVSYMTGLSKDPPNFTKSYIAGIVGGATYPFTIAGETIDGMSTGAKIAANGYNAFVNCTAAFGSNAITHQDNPDLAAGVAAGATGLGSWAQAALPKPYGNWVNQAIQGISGPFQNAIQKASGK